MPGGGNVLARDLREHQPRGVLAHAPEVLPDGGEPRGGEPGPLDVVEADDGVVAGDRIPGVGECLHEPERVEVGRRHRGRGFEAVRDHRLTGCAPARLQGGRGFVDEGRVEVEPALEECLDVGVVALAHVGVAHPSDERDPGVAVLDEMPDCRHHTAAVVGHHHRAVQLGRFVADRHQR